MCPSYIGYRPYGGIVTQVIFGVIGPLQHGSTTICMFLITILVTTPVTSASVQQYAEMYIFRSAANEARSKAKIVHKTARNVTIRFGVCIPPTSLRKIKLEPNGTEKCKLPPPPARKTSDPREKSDRNRFKFAQLFRCLTL